MASGNEGAGDEGQAQGDRIPPVAAWLGAAGLIPFLVGAGSLVYLALSDIKDVPFERTAAERPAAFTLSVGGSLALYAAIILSFMGGVQWGLAVARNPTGFEKANLSNLQLVVSIMPALFSCAYLPLSGNPHGFLAVAAGFAALLAFDLWTVSKGCAPNWYGRLRIRLTAVVLACLGIAYFAVLSR